MMGLEILIIGYQCRVKMDEEIDKNGGYHSLLQMKQG